MQLSLSSVCSIGKNPPVCRLHVCRFGKYQCWQVICITQRAMAETRFLAGPHSRGSELRFALHVFREFIRGFRNLHFIGPCVTVFGSARFTDDHRYYTVAREIGGCLARLGFTVMTGGSPESWKL